MNISLVSIERDGYVRLSVEGNLVVGSTPSTGPNPLQNLLGQTWFQNRVLIDMSKCDYMDSAAIGWLMSSQKSFRENGGQLVLHSMQPRVRQLIDLLRIGRVIQIMPDEAAAKSQLNLGGAR